MKIVGKITGGGFWGYQADLHLVHDNEKDEVYLEGKSGWRLKPLIEWLENTHADWVRHFEHPKDPTFPNAVYMVSTEVTRP